MSGIVQVTAAVLAKNGRILIARRRPGDHQAGRWELPGGKVEAGESPEQCLARELREELNLSVSVAECIGSNTHRYDHVTIELLVFRAIWKSGRPAALAHAEFRWAAPGELERYEFAPADRPFIRKLQRGQIDIHTAPATR